VQIDPSRPPGDAPCPNCGHLLWFGPQEQIEKEELKKQEARLRRGELTLTDFKKLIGQTKKLGPLNKILSMVPGMGGIARILAGRNPDKDMRRLTGIIDAMTPDERRSPIDILDKSRRDRIAKGAGVMPSDVRTFVTQFEGIAAMMKKMSGMGVRDRMRLRRGRHGT
jgi:signal recognition particle subunit SRP54